MEGSTSEPDDLRRVLETLQGVTDAMHQSGIPPFTITTAAFNVYVRSFASLRPTDAQIEQMIVLFRDGVKQIRDEVS